MSPFWQAALGKWAGGISVALFIAVCTVLGFGPDAWVDYFIEALPVWATPYRARVSFVVLGGIVTFYMFIAPVLRNILGGRTRRDVDGLEAVDWIAQQSVWGWFQRAKYNVPSFVHDFAYGEFQAGAQDGRITVRGQMIYNQPHTELHRDYWQIARLDHTDMDLRRTPGGKTVSTALMTGGASASGLLIERGQLQKAWPRAPYWLRGAVISYVRIKMLYWGTEKLLGRSAKWVLGKISALKKLVNRIS